MDPDHPRLRREADRAQRRDEFPAGHICRLGGVSEGGHQDEMQPATDHFLIVRGSPRDGPRREVTNGGERPEVFDGGPKCCGSARRGDATALSQRQGGEHAIAYGLPVQKPPIARGRFQCMSQGMAEVEDASESAFTLVGRDDRGLDPARFSHDGIEHGFNLRHVVCVGSRHDER